MSKQEVCSKYFTLSYQTQNVHGELDGFPDANIKQNDEILHRTNTQRLIQEQLLLSKDGNNIWRVHSKLFHSKQIFM